MTIYFVAGGEGCDGVPGRGDIRVRELGTLMMLGVRGPVEPLNPLCETVSVGRGYDKQNYKRLLISCVLVHLLILLINLFNIISSNVNLGDC